MFKWHKERDLEVCAARFYQACHWHSHINLHFQRGKKSLSCKKRQRRVMQTYCKSRYQSVVLYSLALSPVCASCSSKRAHCTFLILPLDVVEEFPEALAHRLLLGFSPNDCADPLCRLILTQFVILCLKGSKSHSNCEMNTKDGIN